MGKGHTECCHRKQSMNAAHTHEHTYTCEVASELEIPDPDELVAVSAVDNYREKIERGRGEDVGCGWVVGY